LVIENLSFVIGKDGSENFAKNAQFSEIALQRVLSFIATLRLCVFALKGLSLSVQSCNPWSIPLVAALPLGVIGGSLRLS
jgi:hypothetical protein